MKEDNFEVKYEYLPSRQAEARLQRGFEIIFEKIVNTARYGQTNTKILTITQ